MQQAKAGLKPYQGWWQHWLSRRLPAQSPITLAHKSIFILPSAFGLFWLGVVILLFLFGTNYQNNLVIGLALLLLSIFNTCIIYSYRNLAGLTLNAAQGPAVYAGEDVLYPVELTAKQAQHQIQLRYGNNAPLSAARVDDKKQRLLLPFTNHGRGWIHPGRLTVETHYPLGLCRAWSVVDLANRQLVFAAPKAVMTPLSQQAAHAHEQAHLKGSLVAGVEEFNTLKPYVSGESPNQIAWKQLAQGRGMLTKSFGEPVSAPTWLILNAQHPDIEQHLSELTWTVDTLWQTQQVFGLQLPMHTIAPNSGAAHRLQCLTALAVYPEVPNAVSSGPPPVMFHTKEPSPTQANAATPEKPTSSQEQHNG